MCALDLCALGLTPLIQWESINSWVDLAEQNLHNSSAIKNGRKDLKRVYERLQLAVHQRANLIQKLNCANLAEYKVEPEASD